MAAAQVFAIPELCGIILHHLSKEEKFRVQNTTRVTRGYLHDFVPWRVLILHKDAVSGRPVKPVRTRDPKSASWEYADEREEDEARGNSRYSTESADDESEEGEARGELRHTTELAECSSDTTPSSTDAAQPSTQPAEPADAASANSVSLSTRFSRLGFGEGSSSNAAPSSSSYAAPLPANTSSPSSNAISASTVTPTSSAGSNLTPAIVPSTSASTTSTPAIVPSRSRRILPLPRTSSSMSEDLPPQFMPEINWLIKEKFPKCSYYASVNLLGLEEEVPMGAYFTNPDASYRPLLLFWPPIAKLRVHDHSSKQFMVHNPEGITVGDVVDALFADQLT